MNDNLIFPLVKSIFPKEKLFFGIIDEFIINMNDYFISNLNQKLDKISIKKSIERNLKQQFKHINNKFRDKNNSDIMSTSTNSLKNKDKCNFILLTGKNKGKNCSFNKLEYSNYCKKHLNKENKEEKSENNNRVESLDKEKNKEKNKEEITLCSESEQVILSNECSLESENKIEKIRESESSIRKNENKIIIRKNNYGNLVYGNTGLILKAIEDINGKIRNRVVAKEGLNGEWIELNHKDIEICKKYKLRYEKIEFKRNVIVNTIKYTSKIPLMTTKWKEEIKPIINYNIEEESDSE
jgi:hypothetical protein